MFIVRHISHFVLGEDDRKASVRSSPLCGVECAGNLRQFRRHKFYGSRGGWYHYFCKGGFTKGCLHHGGDQCCRFARNFALFFRLTSSGLFGSAIVFCAGRFRSDIVFLGRRRCRTDVDGLTISRQRLCSIYGLSFDRVSGNSSDTLQGIGSFDRVNGNSAVVLRSWCRIGSFDRVRGVSAAAMLGDWLSRLG